MKGNKNRDLTSEKEHPSLALFLRFCESICSFLWTRLPSTFSWGGIVYTPHLRGFLTRFIDNKPLQFRVIYTDANLSLEDIQMPGHQALFLWGWPARLDPFKTLLNIRQNCYLDPWGQVLRSLPPTGDFSMALLALIWLLCFPGFPPSSKSASGLMALLALFWLFYPEC